MVPLLLSVGGAGVLASLFALGFGFANNGFDLGNTLIIAGASGLGSSLVLIALAAVVRELRRLADALPARLAARGLPAEPADAPTAAIRTAAGQRVPYPPRPAPEAPAREPRVAEPRGAPEAYDEPEAERPRPNIFAAARGEPPLPIEPDMAPLAPARAAPPPMSPPPMMPPPVAPPPAAESPYEAKFGPADILARLGGRPKPEAPRDLPRPPAAGEMTGEPAPHYEPSEPPPRPEPTRSGRGGAFDSVWPTEKPPRSGEADAVARAPRPEPRPEPKFEPVAEPKYEPKFEPKRPRPEPPPLQSAVVGPPPPPSAPAPARAAEPRTASILKSGVIDGMAYTLYTDGSIEAQLPQGTVHFASIEELRLHLERNS
jgi:hypothetical protein